MSTLVLDGKHVNAGEIAKLDHNNAIINLAPMHSTDAATETSIDMADVNGGVYIKASDTMKYSLDDGTTYIDFEMEAAKAQYLNKTVGMTGIKVKNDNADTAFVVFKA